MIAHDFDYELCRNNIAYQGILLIYFPYYRGNGVDAL